MSPKDEGQELVGAVLRQRWRILRPIGAGGLGLVFEVESLSTRARHAAKLLRPEFCTEPAVVERFLAEAQASARIRHPGVVQVIECDRAEDGSPYLVMELLFGEPLSQAMNRGRLSVEQSAAIAGAVLDTLAAAHVAGVVHRDLKPDNVFLMGVDHPVRVKLLDFGLARVIDVAGGPSRKTNTGMMLGTPGYMSPEQVRNAKEASVPADLWSVGVILYEMLTGIRAFAAANEFERMTKVLTELPTPIEHIAPQYAHWAPFFARALARDPSQRFPTAEAMKAAIEQATKGPQMATAVNLMSTIRSSSFPHAPSSPPSVAVVSPAPPRGPFGGVDTAVSAGVMAIPEGAPPSSDAVKIVQLPRRGIPLWLALALTLTAFGVGTLAGFVLGQQ